MGKVTFWVDGVCWELDGLFRGEFFSVGGFLGFVFRFFVRRFCGNRCNVLVFMKLSCRRMWYCEWIFDVEVCSR